MKTCFISGLQTKKIKINAAFVHLRHLAPIGQTLHAANSLPSVVLGKRLLQEVRGVKFMSVESSVATIASARHPYSAAILDGSPSRGKGGHVLCSHCGDDSLVDWCCFFTRLHTLLRCVEAVLVSTTAAVPEPNAALAGSIIMPLENKLCTFPFFFGKLANVHGCKSNRSRKDFHLFSLLLLCWRLCGSFWFIQWCRVCSTDALVGCFGCDDALADGDGLTLGCVRRDHGVIRLRAFQVVHGDLCA